MPEDKQNYNSTSIFCEDCDSLEVSEMYGYICNNFCETLRVYHERNVVHFPVKCKDCSGVGVFNPYVSDSTHG